MVLKKHFQFCALHVNVGRIFFIFYFVMCSLIRIFAASNTNLKYIVINIVINYVN